MAEELEIHPKIIFEDTHLIVLDKPAGLLSQGEHTGDANLVDWLRAHVGRNYVGLIHRLDRNTSGIMVVAKRTKSAQRLTEALQSGELTRTYLAILRGDLKNPARWRHLLVKTPETNVVRVVSDPKTPGAKPSALRVVPLKTRTISGEILTLAELSLETGRSHQIRVQAAAEGFALLGDVKYGKGAKSSVPFARPALHSSRLSFPHPMSREGLTFEAALAEDMRNIFPTP